MVAIYNRKSKRVDITNEICGDMPIHTTENVETAKCRNLTGAGSGRVIFASTAGPPIRYIKPLFVPVERASMSHECFARDEGSLPSANKPAIGSMARAVTSTGISNNRKVPGLQSASSRKSGERSVSPASLCLRNIVRGGCWRQCCVKRESEADRDRRRKTSLTCEKFTKVVLLEIQ